MNIPGRLKVMLGLVAVTAGLLLFAGEDYRWTGHALFALTAFSLTALVVTKGAALAGRIRRPADRARFPLHRKYGLLAGTLVLTTFAYGIATAILRDILVLNSVHGLVGLLLVVLFAIQIFTGLSPRRLRLKTFHRWNGYTLAVIFVVQLGFGILASPLFTEEYPRYRVRWITLFEDNPWRADGFIDRQEYFITRVLDDGNYELSYRSDGQFIYVGLKVKTEGWAAIGLSAGSGMKDADIIFAYVSDGKAAVEDHYGTARGAHSPDTALGGTNDIVEFGGREADGFTIIEFKRPLVTQDKFDIPLVEGISQVMWAYALTDSVTEMHVAQGNIEVYLGPR
ncbi:MAG: hypothetical protein HYX91_00130 [Chloroflexi bacterium]|nr:hypothetical protein [Chloroflexota bacterium]